MKNFIKDNPVRLAIILLLIGYVFFSSRAEAAGYIDFGPTQVGSNSNTGWMATLNETFGDKGQYDLSIGYITEQDMTFSCGGCFHADWHLKAQTFIGATIWAEDPWRGKFKIGIGPYYFSHPDRVGTANFRIGVFLRYDLTDRWSILAKHFSTANSGEVMCFSRDVTTMELVQKYTPNGNNVLRSNTFTQCHDWNTGQDSLLRIAYRW